ncbi:hypothetical protein AB0G67_40500 [Streptomyces sp. NPDC021056]|uniref:hypothetical protein n=1 Tax=Streptomyces sp. NPDC021056 TaxID=3155012 RepID=UPI0033EE4350
MATDTVPAAVPGPPETPPTTAANAAPNAATNTPAPTGFWAAMTTPVEPARPTPAPFDLTPTDGTSGHPATADGALDRSTPGVSSASFRDATDQATRDNDPAGARNKRSVWKELWLAAATRWAKGGGTANKRLELERAKAQARSHQVKENRTTNMVRSGGLPVRDTGGSGAGTRKGNDKPSGNSGGKGPSNSNGNRSNGSAGRGSSGGHGSSGAGGGRGSNGNGRHGNGGSGGGNGRGPASKDTAAHGPRGAADKAKNTGADKKPGKDKDAGKHSGGQGGTGKNGGAGTSGKDGAPGKAGATGKDIKAPGATTDLSKNPKQANGKDADPKTASGSRGPQGQTNGQQKTAADKPSLQKSRETGHGDGSTARRVVDHVVAYTDGVRDGWNDEKTKNGKEHERLDKAHDQAKDKEAPKGDSKTGPTPAPADGQKTTATTNDGRRVVIVTEEGDDGVSTDVKPLTVTSIDTKALTLGTDGARNSIGRKELRNYCQYQTKLTTKETVLQKIHEACKQLQTEAENEAKDCQKLAEQAKSVKGGEKLIAELNRLADAAKNQAAEAAELAKRAHRAAEMCKVVLTNIQTRYQPLYQAVVDSDEVKPAEMRFYNDKGYYATAA